MSAPLNLWEYWAWKEGQPVPKNPLRRVSVLVKENGKFVHKPYHVDLCEDFNKEEELYAYEDKY